MAKCVEERKEEGNFREKNEMERELTVGSGLFDLVSRVGPT